MKSYVYAMVLRVTLAYVALAASSGQVFELPLCVLPKHSDHHEKYY